MVSSSTGWNNDKSFNNYLNGPNTFFNTEANENGTSILIDLSQNYLYSIINAVRIVAANSSSNWNPGIKIKLLDDESNIINLTQIPLNATSTESSIIIYNDSSVLPTSDYSDTIIDSELGYVEEAGGVNGLNGTGGDQGTLYQSPDLWGIKSSERLFDGNIASQWHGAATAENEIEFVTFEFPTAKRIVRYRAWYNGNLGWQDYPHGFTMKGSDDNSTFTQLHTVTDLSSASGVWSLATLDSDIVNGTNCLTFDIPQNMQGSYKYYRIEMQTFTQYHGSGNQHTRLGAMVLYSNSGI